MEADRYGYELTTPSPAADGGALEAFERVIVEDDAFALAHAGRARLLYLRGHGGEARVEADRARALVASERERSHVEVLATMITGDAIGALQRIRAHVARFPRDAFAISSPPPTCSD